MTAISRAKRQGASCRNAFVALFLTIGLLFAGAAPASAAQIYYLGIGNEGFQADVTSAANTWGNYATLPASIATYYDKTGPDIVSLLNLYKNTLVAGDTLFFHYSGHGGGGIADAAPLDEGNGGNNGTEGVIGMSNNPYDSGVFSPFNPLRAARDDAIAAELNGFAASVAVIAIFDNCFAGEMVDGTSDISRGLIIGTSDADNCAQGNSLFMPYFNDAFSILNGKFKADSNMDGLLTVGELWGHLDDIHGVMNGQGGTAFALNFNEPANHLNYTIAQVVPLPPAIWGFVGAVMVLTWLRRKVAPVGAT
jgi:hypothetical protein